MSDISTKTGRKLKKCPPGKERNPATNRCRKIRKKKDTTRIKPKPINKKKAGTNSGNTTAPPGGFNVVCNGNSCRLVPSSKSKQPVGAALKLEDLEKVHTQIKKVSNIQRNYDAITYILEDHLVNDDFLESLRPQVPKKTLQTCKKKIDEIRDTWIHAKVFTNLTSQYANMCKKFYKIPKRPVGEQFYFQVWDEGPKLDNIFADGSIPPPPKKRRFATISQADFFKGLGEGTSEQTGFKWLLDGVQMGTFATAYEKKIDPYAEYTEENMQELLRLNKGFPGTSITLGRFFRRYLLSHMKTEQGELKFVSRWVHEMTLHSSQDADYVLMSAYDNEDDRMRNALS